jgi:hypothetical protein
VSKESRRAARLARESRRAAGAGRPMDGGGSGPAGSPTAGTGAATSRPAAGTASRRPVASTPGTRAGRRDRPRAYHQPSFFERYRNAIIGVAAVAAVAIVGAFLFFSSTAAAFSCSTEFNPSPTPTVSPGSSERLGFVEDYMGATHQAGPPFVYTYCPPASGNHYAAQGLGPIQPRVYKPSDKVGPPNWVHNLEHGALVVLYRSDSPGATPDGQAAFNDFYNTFPPSPICKVPKGAISPVIAAFDQMPHPYAALVWGRVLYMDTWDPDLVRRFYATESERLDANGTLVAPPEKLYCNVTPSPSAAGSAAASAAGSAAGSPAASDAGSPGTSAGASAAASPAPS